jgi:hypothetical protein
MPPAALTMQPANEGLMAMIAVTLCVHRDPGMKMLMQ